MPRVLCVAEKPSIARAITEILSGGQFTTRNGPSQYNKNFDFTYPQTKSHYTVTSVSGHMLEHDFPETHRKWHSCDPFELFDAPIETRVKQDAKQLERNLRQEAASADTLMIWTDCDREGENIGNEVKKACRKANRNIRVVRARFSAIIPAQIHNAAQHPVELDLAQSDAVEARTILDLRLGAAFTRMQSLALQGSIGELDGTLISYGPCQFPTLGFVVSRYEQVKSFSPENFWYIYLTLTTDQPGEGEVVTEFSWKRHRLFDLETCYAIYELVMENPLATVTRVTRKNTTHYKPYPLTTVELQKQGSRLLKITPKKILDIAESLYQKGFLSYPRTETDQFDNAFDFHSLIEKQTADANWGTYATGLQNGGFSKPRKGQKNDKAHPPIHPTAHVSNLTGDDKRVYEFITRRFLACCSKDAEGFQTTVEVNSGGEDFSATGLVVLERNFLDVYIYDKWKGKFLPNYEEGQTFMPTVCEMRDGTTTAPSYLTEADLVTLMDKNGIGTDATIAQHIQTIIDRDYVMERTEGRTKYLVPSTLGIGLVDGYNKIGFDKSLSMPQLRREVD
ncbi:prokaryotic type I DNA topoisomerase [Clavulina sp. PMI_390]|nr:prokaryotic type I DNA topoisomerase [Clavulina sp. PMI_390]